MKIRKKTVKTAASVAAGFGASWITQQALLALVPLPVQIPLRVLHFCGTVALGSAASRIGKAAIEKDVDEICDAFEATKNQS